MTQLIAALLLSSVLWLSGCGSGHKGKTSGEDILIDQLTLFVEATQGDRWDKAMALLNPEEKSRILGADGVLSEDMKFKLKAMRLSTLAHRGLVRLDKHDKLEGIYDALPKDLAPAPVELQPEVPSFQ